MQRLEEKEVVVSKKLLERRKSCYDTCDINDKGQNSKLLSHQ